MTNKFRIFLAIAGWGLTLTVPPATAQFKATGVLLKVAVPTVIAGHTLQPGSYQVNSWTEPNVVTIQKAGRGNSSMFLLPSAVSDGDAFRGAETPRVEFQTSASGVTTITSIYFAAQDRAYYFSPGIEDRSHVSHGQQASASTAVQ
jgi:hypothetical protein